MIIIIALIGILFSGYLTIGQLISGTCPIGGGCPFLWSYPVCMYGLIIFMILFVTSIILYYKKDDQFDKKVLLYVSLAGVLFSLYFSIKELFFTTYTPGFRWPLLMPTCIYGLIMYLIIFCKAVKINGCCKK